MLLGVVIPRNVGAQLSCSTVLDTLTSWPWALQGNLLMITMHDSYRDFLQSVAVLRVGPLGVSTLAIAEELITCLGFLLLHLQFHILYKPGMSGVSCPIADGASINRHNKKWGR